MVGGFVEQKNVGMLDESFNQGEAFLPAAGQFGRRGIKVVEAGAAKSLGEARAALRCGEMATIECGIDYGTYGGSVGKARILLDVTEADAFANRDFPAIGFDLAHQNAQQSGLARSVRTNQSDTVAFGDGERDILEKRLRSESFRHFLRVDQGRQLGTVLLL